MQGVRAMLKRVSVPDFAAHLEKNFPAVDNVRVLPEGIRLALRYYPGCGIVIMPGADKLISGLNLVNALTFDGRRLADISSCAIIYEALLDCGISLGLLTDGVFENYFGKEWPGGC